MGSKLPRIGLAEFWLGLLLGLFGTPAFADSTSVGVSFTTDRDAHDIDVPKDAKVKINLSHNFDSGIVLGTSGEYTNNSFSNNATVKLEGTAGYRLELSKLFSVTGSAGLGENIQASGSGDSFPYYVFRIGADIKATDKITWNMVTFRYRDGFDPDDNFLTPQAATGLSYSFDERNSISGTVQYNWKDWKPDSIGLELGYKYRF
jgi:hypothetical protein